MRISEAIPRGRKVHLYHPELFSNHEEVIIYTRDEFRRNYLSMQESIDFIMKSCYCFDQDKYWEIEGLWPRIMERIHFINVNMEMFLDKVPSQAYLDTYIEVPVDPSEDLLLEPARNISPNSLLADWL